MTAPTSSYFHAKPIAKSKTRDGIKCMNKAKTTCSPLYSSKTSNENIDRKATNNRPKILGAQYKASFIPSTSLISVYS